MRQRVNRIESPGTMRLVFFYATVWLMTGMPVQAQEKGLETAERTPWIAGNTGPASGTIFEAWFDRSVVDPHNRMPDVEVGSPSDIAIWLRRSGETCASAEAAARKRTDSSDGAVLYACIRPRVAGTFRLVASTGAAPLFVSEPIEVAAGRVLSPTVAAVLSTLLGFLAGLLTSYVQGRMQLAREEESTRNTVEATLAKVLSAEMFENQQTVDRVASGGEPQILKTAAYNNASDLGPLAWGYLSSAKTAAYRERIDKFYTTQIIPYQGAVRAWQTAQPADKPTRHAEAMAQAEALLATMQS